MVTVKRAEYQREYQRKYRQTDKGKEIRRKAQLKHRKTIRGHLHICYDNLEQRCENTNYSGWKHYGGRGISNKFRSFNEFYDYVTIQLGYDNIEKFKGLQIDRIDNDGNYEKGNIRFVSAKVNNNNKRKELI